MGKTKTNSEMLHALRQYNKTAREVKAVKEGFTSAKDMDDYLSGEIKDGRGSNFFSNPYNKSKAPCPTTTKAPSASKGSKTPKSSPLSSPTNTPSPTGSRPTIHIVDILDSSGSMSGPKISAAVEGINHGVRTLQTDTTDVNYTYTLTDFSEDVIFRHVMVPISDVPRFKGETRGSTALFDAIGKTAERLSPFVKSEDKVLINIYTDGQENCSRWFNAETINKLIQFRSDFGWTFTFIGTEKDVAFAQRMLSIKDSNTLVYDGTAKGLEKSFVANTSARSNYSSKVSRGEDVSEGFYKDIN